MNILDFIFGVWLFSSLVIICIGLDHIDRRNKRDKKTELGIINEKLDKLLDCLREY